ncbi:Uncharacterized protein BP5553_05502 [Venustampulla echinocandica]|uniref:Uncharacterized protein n=1 Tax=Venustampulla echinocandica TaxID=2656787 RepID=A0A370TRC0_9HELO|nr:Uncharacterized protein BP5553_05502 [Venustampulla echinocandica]RDL38069.1 Uncharacterized protein BP5553_05502 [Venustampulla echinocandica]
MDDEDGGLFNIHISSSDESADESPKVPRDFQSEKDFQQQKAAWRPKIEPGETNQNVESKLWKTLKLPMNNPSKPESQAVLHAIEELYFFRRYEEAKKVAEDALKGELSADYKKVVVGYRTRCDMKLDGVKSRIKV